MEEDLVVGRHRIPGSELAWSFGPTGGPGGQHANRSHTRAELRLDVAATAGLPDEVKERVLGRLGNRLVDGVLVVVADEHRSQWQNRRAARARMTRILTEAARVPRPRRPTRPTAASRERRLQAKKARSETKRLRRPPE